MGRAERNTKEKERGGLDSAPQRPTTTPKKKSHRVSGWPHRAEGQKVRGKVSFVPSIPSGAQRRICTPIRPHKHMLTHMHMHTHRLASA